jgi:hypothetical protein
VGQVRIKVFPSTVPEAREPATNTNISAVYFISLFLAKASKWREKCTFVERAQIVFVVVNVGPSSSSWRTGSSPLVIPVVWAAGKESVALLSFNIQAIPRAAHNL